MACLAKPVEAGILLDFLRSRTTGLAAQGELEAVHEVDDLHDDDLDAELMDRLQEMYVSALPGRLSAIDAEHDVRATPRPSSRPRTPWPAPAASSGTRRSPRSAGPSPPTPAGASWPTPGCEHLHALAGV